MIGADDAAFQDRKVTLSGVCVGIAANVFLGAVVNRAMAGKLLADSPIDARFIGAQMRSATETMMGRSVLAVTLGTWNDRARPPRSTSENTTSFFGVLPFRLRALPPT